jgi:hypothetical protein
VELRFGKQPTPEQIRSVFGKRAEYDVGLLQWMAEAAGGHSPERARLLEQACKLLADTCTDLARHLVAAKRDAEAVQALQRAFEHAHNRVGLTHSTFPLVRHYHEKGQHVEATRIAQDAAETGSSSGMSTMGLLLEWRGELGEAEGYFQQLERRYQHPQPLVGFYYRMVEAGRSDYESKFQRGIRAAFPDGLERLDTSRLPRAPSDGVRLSNPGPDAALVGLEAGDIIVGLDGWRVHSFRQYLYPANFDFRPDMTIYLWHKGRYMELHAHVMTRDLPLDLGTYPTDKPGDDE